MKRVFSYLITSLFVLGFALGAVGCSGDLMDDVPVAKLASVSGYDMYIMTDGVSSAPEKYKMTKDGDDYKIDLAFMGKGWSASPTGFRFCFVYVPESSIKGEVWNGEGGMNGNRWGTGDDVPTSDKWIKFSPTGTTASLTHTTVNVAGNNLMLDGLTIGQTYTIKMNPDTNTLNVSQAVGLGIVMEFNASGVKAVQDACKALNDAVSNANKAANSTAATVETALGTAVTALVTAVNSAAVCGTVTTSTDCIDSLNTAAAGTADKPHPIYDALHESKVTTANNYADWDIALKDDDGNDNTNKDVQLGEAKAQYIAGKITSAMIAVQSALVEMAENVANKDALISAPELSGGNGEFAVTVQAKKDATIKFTLKNAQTGITWGGSGDQDISSEKTLAIGGTDLCTLAIVKDNRYKITFNTGSLKISASKLSILEGATIVGDFDSDKWGDAEEGTKTVNTALKDSSAYMDNGGFYTFVASRPTTKFYLEGSYNYYNTEGNKSFEAPCVFTCANAIAITATTNSVPYKNQTPATFTATPSNKPNKTFCTVTGLDVGRTYQITFTPNDVTTSSGAHDSTTALSVEVERLEYYLDGGGFTNTTSGLINQVDKSDVYTIDFTYNNMESWVQWGVATDETKFSIFLRRGVDSGDAWKKCADRFGNGKFGALGNPDCSIKNPSGSDTDKAKLLTKDYRFVAGNSTNANGDTYTFPGGEDAYVGGLAAGAKYTIFLNPKKKSIYIKWNSAS